MKHTREIWAVVGFTRHRAWQVMQNIEIQHDKYIARVLYGKNALQIVFEDGTILMWVPENDRQRGHRFSKMWCDKNINKDILNEVILPRYRGKWEDIIWLDC